mgnify:CR=1 FL=1
MKRSRKKVAPTVVTADPTNGVPGIYVDIEPIRRGSIIVGTPNPFSAYQWQERWRQAREDFEDAFRYAIPKRFTVQGITEAAVLAVRNVLPAHVMPPPDELLRTWFELEDEKKEPLLEWINAWKALDDDAKSVVLDYAKQIGGVV